MTEFLTGLQRSTGNTVVEGIDLLRAIVRVVTEMLHDRGCSDVCACAIEDVAQHMRDNVPVITALHPTTRVLFCDEERLSIKNVRLALQNDTEGKTILFSFEGPTTFSRRETQYNTNYQFLRYKDFIVNITRHVLVPKHTRCAPEDIPAVDKLPCMLHTDPVAQYYDFQPGAIVRIARTYGSTTAYDYFRRIVHAT